MTAEIKPSTFTGRKLIDWTVFVGALFPDFFNPPTDWQLQTAANLFERGYDVQSARPLVTGQM
jgi:hypothetical protein